MMKVVMESTKLALVFVDYYLETLSALYSDEGLRDDPMLTQMAKDTVCGEIEKALSEIDAAEGPFDFDINFLSIHENIHEIIKKVARGEYSVDHYEICNDIRTIVVTLNEEG